MPVWKTLLSYKHFSNTRMHTNRQACLCRDRKGAQKVSLGSCRSLYTPKSISGRLRNDLLFQIAVCHEASVLYAAACVMYRVHSEPQPCEKAPGRVCEIASSWFWHCHLREHESVAARQQGCLMERLLWCEYKYTTWGSIHYLRMQQMQEREKRKKRDTTQLFNIIN